MNVDGERIFRSYKYRDNLHTKIETLFSSLRGLKYIYHLLIEIFINNDKFVGN